jgi:hypothetical protein
MGWAGGYFFLAYHPEVERRVSIADFLARIFPGNPHPDFHAQNYADFFSIN